MDCGVRKTAVARVLGMGISTRAVSAVGKPQGRREAVRREEGQVC